MPYLFRAGLDAVVSADPCQACSKLRLLFAPRVTYLVSTMVAKSAIPRFYFLMFAVYEPLLTLVGFLGALVDPKKVCCC